MTKPDVIITWPRNCDYPLWRQFIRDNRDRFNSVFIGIHNSNTSLDFAEFVKGAMADDNVQIFNAPEPRAGIEDWRNLSVNASLFQSHSEWVWFTEQDFYPKDGFWQEVELLETKCDVIAVYQENRMHPCCIFIKREVLDKTRKDFGIVPNKSDHFSLIQQDLENNHAKIGIINPEFYHHYNGLSQNWTLACDGLIPNYLIDEFVDWIKQCLAVIVPHSVIFDDIANAVIRKFDPIKEAKNAPLTTPLPSK